MCYTTLTEQRIKNSCDAYQWKHLTDSTFFHNKNLQQTRNRRIYFHIIKAMYKKPTANILFNGEKWRAFPLILRTWQGCPTLAICIQHSTEALARPIREVREIKDIPIRKEEIKLSLFGDDRILYVENPKDCTKCC